jgi:glutathione S-transferase
MAIVHSYGYSALIAVAGYYLFSDFIGGADEEARKQGIVSSRRVLQELMKRRGGSVRYRGRVSLARGFLRRPDLLPRFTYPRCQRRLRGWFRQMVGADQAMPSYQATAPQFS